MKIFTITRNGVEQRVLKLQLKDLDPKRIRSTGRLERLGLTQESYVFVKCKPDGTFKFNHIEKFYKIHTITEEDSRAIFYEDYLSFPLVDHIENTIYN